MKLELNKFYIIRCNDINNEYVEKVQVIELTEKSVLFNYIDSRFISRESLEDFYNRFDVLEEITLNQKDVNRTRGFELVENKKHKDFTAVIPQRADVGSCGYDLYSPINVVVKPNEQVLIFTDLKAYMLKDEVLIMNVRSSQGKIRISLANTIGWIDSTYYNNPDNEGNIGIYIKNNGSEDYRIYNSVESGGKEFKAIAQVMFTKYLITDEDLPLSQDRKGGFGSSNK